jgi:hypothetical protein
MLGENDRLAIYGVVTVRRRPSAQDFCLVWRPRRDSETRYRRGGSDDPLAWFATA